LQQTPSTQLSDVHFALSSHATPFFERHAPSPSQVWSPEQLESASSVNLGTGAQVPSEPGSPHDWQVPQVAPPQQTPSTQFPDAHSLENAHAFPRTLRHAPAPSQIESPLQLSSVAFLIGEQVPTLPVSAQPSQDPPHARSQQTPSTQKPVAH
jgi:hypothetical protein